GRAAIAKFGKPPPASTVERLKKQIKEGKRTYLILVVKSASTRKTHLGYQTEIARLSQWSTAPPCTPGCSGWPTCSHSSPGPLRREDCRAFRSGHAGQSCRLTAPAAARLQSPWAELRPRQSPRQGPWQGMHSSSRSCAARPTTRTPRTAGARSR